MKTSPRIKIVFSTAAAAVVLPCTGAATVSTGFNELKRARRRQSHE